jgi:hypothetical protein
MRHSHKSESLSSPPSDFIYFVFGNRFPLAHPSEKLDKIDREVEKHEEDERCNVM